MSHVSELSSLEKKKRVLPNKLLLEKKSGRMEKKYPGPATEFASEASDF